jgi:hypothetical protein
VIPSKFLDAEEVGRVRKGAVFNEKRTGENDVEALKRVSLSPQ